MNVNVNVLYVYVCLHENEGFQYLLSKPQLLCVNLPLLHFLKSNQ